MKTAVSIPDEIFKEAERLAKRIKKSRSRLFNEALSEYIARRTPEKITRAMDAAVTQIATDDAEFARPESRRVLKNTEW